MTFLLIERNETKNLILIRLTLLLVVGLLIFLLSKEMNDYLVFFTLIFLPLFFISITELKIFSSSILIKKYYFFGIIPIEHKIYKGDKIKITTIDTSISDIDPEVSTPDIESERYKIKYTDASSGESKDFSCKLKENEVKIIREVLTLD